MLQLVDRVEQSRRRRKSRARRVRWLLVGIGVLWVASGAQAELVSGTVTGGTAAGPFSIITPPVEIVNNAYDDDEVRAFDELQDHTLAANQILDRVASNLTSNVIGAGSVVSSHYILFDPGSSKTVIGSATFDEPVLGVIIENIRFNETDTLLGNPATLYTIGSQELEGSDDVTISGNTVSFDLTANSPGDAIRVLTGVNPIPGINVCAPGTETLTGVITGGDAASMGGAFKQICDPIGDVGNNNFDSFDLFGFEEQQAVELDADLFLDATTVISSGAFVSSFYVVWDPIPNNRVIADVTFPDTIIGVIRDKTQLEDSEFLGNASANYLNPNLLGLESGDVATFAGNVLSVDLVAGTPGDSIRVILGSASPSLSYNVCDPEDMTLSGSVTGGTAGASGGTFSELCEPIGPVGNNNFQSNDLFAFPESENVVLTAPLVLDDPASTTLTAGTVVSSYYVAFDPSNSKDIVGDVTFPGAILGVASSTSNLNASDHLGNATATYLNPGLRGLELGTDVVSFSGSTLSVQLSADSPGDYVRVIVAPVAVPTMGPIGTGILSALLVALAARRRSRQAT